MSLSDYLKYLRAAKGGLTPWEIAEGSGVPAREIHLMEVKHRRVGENDAALQRLADFFGVPAQDLQDRREAFRKRLATFLDEGQSQSAVVVLKLEDGEELSGKVSWFGREALALTPESGEDAQPYIVQRGWVRDWRRADSLAWEVQPES